MAFAVGFAIFRPKGENGPLGPASSYGPRGRIGSYSQRAMVGPGRQERSWIRGAQAGSVSDLEALFREHWPRAHRAAFLVVQDGAAAEDIAQEAFLAALRNLDRFDRRRPFGPWLHRLVVNRAIDWSRARALRRETGP
jgi:RNA polymerase sigma-70 factor, ECF subfamily